MADLWQQIVVGLAAAGAALFVARRVVVGLRRPSAGPACEKCEARIRSSQSR